MSNVELSFMSLEDLPSVLTVQELAAVLRISRSEAYKLVDQGVIPSVRIGRSIRVSCAAVQECLVPKPGPSETRASARGAHHTRRAG